MKKLPYLWWAKPLKHGKYVIKSLVANGHAVVATLGVTQYFSVEEVKANANLIAAVPELVEALEFAVDELQLVSDEQEGRFGGSIDKLLLVLIKAKGGYYESNKCR